MRINLSAFHHIAHKRLEASRQGTQIAEILRERGVTSMNLSINQTAHEQRGRHQWADEDKVIAEWNNFLI